MEQELGEVGEHVLRAALGGQSRIHGQDIPAEDADEHGGEQGDNHPDRGDAAGALQLGAFADGHKPQQHLGHAEVAQTPGGGGEDGQQPVGGGAAEEGRSAGSLLDAVCVGDGLGDLGEGEVAGDALGVFNDLTEAAGVDDAAHHHAHQRGDHDHGLHEVGGALRQKAAQNRIQQHEQGAHDHHGVVGVAKEAGEELAAGDEAAGGVNRKENEDEQGGDHQNDLLFLTETVAQEVGDGDGVAGDHGVGVEPAGHQQPVEVGAHGQTDGRPGGVGDAAPVGDTGQTHEQPAAHVGGFGTHGGHPGAEGAAAQKIVVGAGLGFFGEKDADADDDEHVAHHGDEKL